MSIEGFLSDLSQETIYKFGTPWRYSDKSLGVVIPILKKDGVDIGEREYITLEEAKDQGVIFKDTGRIDRVIVESSIDKPIFIRSGTAFKSGGTQPRAVEVSTIIIPQKEGEKTQQEILVRCIHASKPISSNTKFEYGGDVPLEVRSALISRGGQSKTWDSVSYATSRLMSTMSSSRLGSTHHFTAPRSMRMATDNLVGVMEEVDKFTGDIDEILKKVPLFEEQVGAFFLDMKDVVGMEMFDSPKSWEAIHKEVEKRLGESIAKEEDKTFFKPDYEQVKPLVLSFLKKLLEGERTETTQGIISTSQSAKADSISTVSIKGDGVVGEATTINGKVIHLVGLRSKIEKKTDQRAGPYVSNMGRIGIRF